MPVLPAIAGTLAFECADIPDEGIDRFLHYKGSIEVDGGRPLTAQE